MIQAVTFDLWDTVIHDDSDEPKRAAHGQPTKAEGRRRLAFEAFDAVASLDPAHLRLAYDVMEAAFSHVWHDQHVTWTVAERVSVLERGLGQILPDPTRRDLVSALEEMEITVMPDPVEGVGDAIESLAGRYRLAVVSDAIYSPGRCLRQWLAHHGLEDFFGAFAFSDEVGRSKPHRDMFDTVAKQLGVELERMVHIGDREHNDVKGPQALGMKAILFTASRDADREGSSADALCERGADLAAVVDRLAAGD